MASVTNANEGAAQAVQMIDIELAQAKVGYTIAAFGCAAFGAWMTASAAGIATVIAGIAIGTFGTVASVGIACYAIKAQTAEEFKGQIRKWGLIAAGVGFLVPTTVILTAASTTAFFYYIFSVGERVFPYCD